MLTHPKGCRSAACCSCLVVSGGEGIWGEVGISAPTGESGPGKARLEDVGEITEGAGRGLGGCGLPGAGEGRGCDAGVSGCVVRASLPPAPPHQHLEELGVRQKP